jgi:hypothetical protein
VNFRQIINKFTKPTDFLKNKEVLKNLKVRVEVTRRFLKDMRHLYTLPPLIDFVNWQLKNTFKKIKYDKQIYYTGNCILTCASKEPNSFLKRDRHINSTM